LSMIMKIEREWVNTQIKATCLTCDASHWINT
jgi:hypothetical protein